MIIDELRDTLDRHADLVVARPDPYPRIVGLRRRRRRNTAVFAAVVVVLLIVGPTAWLVTGRDGSPYIPAQPPAHLLALLYSPTRGSLAGDTAYLNRLRQRVADEFDGGGMPIPTDPGVFRVLFAGDLGERRVAVLATMRDRPLVFGLEGVVGDSPLQLRSSLAGYLTPVVDITFADRSPVGPTHLLLGPTGSAHESARTRWTGTGVQRTWSPLDSPDGYTAITPELDQRFRVHLGDRLLFEGELATTESAAAISVDAQPPAGRGRPILSVTQRAATALAALTRLPDDEVRYRLLWSDEVDMPGTSTGRAAVATVQAVTDGVGGPFLTLAYNAEDGTVRDHPTGYGVGGDLEHTVIAMRLPWFSEPGEALQILAPPTAVRALIHTGTQVAEVALASGVGSVTLPPDSRATIKVFDSRNVTLAEIEYADPAPGCDFLEPAPCVTG